ncbi:MAG TPA: DUF6588 family protein [Bacteroidales bacterium]|nr:DUF6588 family protein [Bacteroidales bacterium]
MKKTRTISLLFLVMFSLISIKASPQQSVVNFLQGGISDAEKIAEGYMKPLGYGLGSALNAGWFNTARVHNTLGFNVTITFSAAIVPSAYRMFDLSQISFDRLELLDPNVFMAPTISGRAQTRPVLRFSETFPAPVGTVNILEFTSPDGFRMPAVPLPMVRAGVGLPGGFEVFGRFVPKMNYSGSQGSLWGVGFKYDLKKLIPIARRVPFWNFSFLAAYSSLDAVTELDLQRNIYPQTVGTITVTGGRPYYDNQEFEMNSSGYTLNLIASVDIPFLTAFASLGYSGFNTTFGLVGDYPILNVNPAAGTATIVDMPNPVSLEYRNSGEVQLTLGTTFKLAVLHIHAAYTLARYPVATAGIGISFR